MISTIEFRTIELSDPRFERDGVRQATFKSRALSRRADVTFYVPEGVNNRAALPVVLLLHGVYGGSWIWCGKAGAHRTAARMIAAKEIPPMILAMPSDGLWGDGSAYVAHPGGADFERFIVEEVPALALKASAGVSGNSPLFISGLSMGGFGALRVGAKHAGRFAGISAHSSITHFAQMPRFVEEPLAAYGIISAEEQSVFHWMHENASKLPPLRLDCGTEDDLLGANRELHAALENAGIAHVYEEFPGGHEWSYWEKHFEDSLRFFGRCL